MRCIRLRILKSICVATGVAFVGVASALAAADSREAQVDKLFRWATNGPGAAVVVIDHGKVVLEKAYGFADVDKKLPLTVHSVFDLASVTKQFTAMGVMILAQQGRLRYDDSLCKYFPQFSPFGCGITIRHLLNHTSGLPDYTEIFNASGLIRTNYPRAAREAGDTFEPTSKDAVSCLAKSGKLRFQPGEKWEYSDSGYVVYWRKSSKKFPA